MRTFASPAAPTSALSGSNVAAGFITVLVGFTSSIAVVFQAASAAGATPEQTSSWLWSIGMGTGLTCIGLSLRYRAPVVTAWSTAGAAILATSLPGVPMSESIGIFLFSGALATLVGVTGWFEKALSRISLPLASAMLAGILARFGMDVFVAMKSQLVLVLTMLATYVIGKRLWPRYAVISVMIAGSAVAWARGLMHVETFHVALATPVFIAPSFSWPTLIGIGVPLFVVNMASQNVPGVAAIRASGYRTPISPLITSTGVLNMLLAPFGCCSLNLAAITAAICMGKEAHEDPSKRYMAGVFAGLFYLLSGVFGATIGALFTVFPKELVFAVAGIALFATIANGLHTAMSTEHQREPAIITFLVALSGVSLFGIGAAFWALLAGVLTSLALNWRKARAA
ncbi:benzoate/H(+) symporter BenE family transporter [Pendulispora albinea]|uniref:Benzoate/H(+) symporter BenE family transporter n=1 Tax=Pendulispora albinea TaxID=2741071 RepID=A0ABZ2M5V8_9BACT